MKSTVRLLHRKPEFDHVVGNDESPVSLADYHTLEDALEAMRLRLRRKKRQVKFARRALKAIDAWMNGRRDEKIELGGGMTVAEIRQHLKDLGRV